jgi:hypothetical protein
VQIDEFDHNANTGAICSVLKEGDGTGKSLNVGHRSTYTVKDFMRCHMMILLG